jgi:hypothetical protein
VIPRPNGSGNFPYNLTDPMTLPVLPPDAEVVYPPETLHSSLSDEEITNQAVQNVSTIIAQESSQSNCTKCAAGLAVGQQLARTRPSVVPEVLRQLCVKYKFSVSFTPQRPKIPRLILFFFFNLSERSEV